MSRMAKTVVIIVWIIFAVIPAFLIGNFLGFF